MIGRNTKNKLDVFYVAIITKKEINDILLKKYIVREGVDVDSYLSSVDVVVLVYVQGQLNSDKKTIHKVYVVF